MSYDEYWNQSPDLVKAYREAYEIKKAMQNQDNYMKGLYNFLGFKAVMEQFGYGLGGGKGEKPEGFITEPLPITKAEQKLAEEREKEKLLAWIRAGQKQAK